MHPIVERWRARFASPRVRSVLKWLAVAAVMLNFIVFLALPPLVRRIAAKKASEALGRKVTIEKVRLNPYALAITVSGLAIAEPDGAEHFLRIREFHANLEASSLFHLAPVFRSIHVVRPFVHVVRIDATRFNFSDLIKPSAPPSPEEKPLRFSLNDIRIVDGTVDYRDEVVGKAHRLGEINLALPSVSNFNHYIERDVEPSFSAQFDGSPIVLKGRTKPFESAMETAMSFRLQGCDLTKYMPYAPVALNGRLLSGMLTLDLELVYRQSHRRIPTLAVFGDVILADLAVEDNAGRKLCAVPRISVSDLRARPLEGFAGCGSVAVDRPELFVSRGKEGTINLLELLPAGEPAPADKAPSAPFVVEVDAFDLAEGRVVWSDAAAAEPFETTLFPLNVRLRDFSTAPERRMHYAVSVKTEREESIAVEGAASVEPLHVTGQLTAQGLLPQKYGAYFRNAIQVDIPSGVVDVAAAFEADPAAAPLAARLSEVRVKVADLAVHKRGEPAPFLRLASCEVLGAGAQLPEQAASTGQVAVDGFYLSCVRLKNGEVDLLKLLPASEVPSAPPSATASTPWMVDVGTVRVANSALRLRDEAPAAPAEWLIDNISCEIANLSTRPQVEGAMDLSLRIQQAGQLGVKSSLCLNPLGASGRVSLRELPLQPFQPYAQQFLRAVIAKGALAVEGAVSCALRGEELSAGFKGNVAVDQLAVVDQRAGENLVRWDSLRLSEIDASYSPLKLSVAEIALRNPVASAIVREDGATNLGDVLLPQEPEAAAPAVAAAAPTPTTPTPAPEIRLSKIVLTGGEVSFLDRSITPSSSLGIDGLDVTVEGFTLGLDQIADIAIKGRVDQQAPISVQGKLRPAPEKFFLDMRILCDGIDLVAVSPYSGRYAGYGIDKGKLNLDLGWRIDHRRLLTENRVLVDQFTFGEKTDSPQATKLPVRLAVALLRDRNGQIKLNVPVSGSLDDPSFRVMPVVIQVVANLIEKAVTSPFALMGGGEESSFVEFAYGDAAIAPAAREKLDAIAAMLVDRPAVQMDIRTQTVAVPDSEALKTFLLQRKVKLQKFQELARRGASFATLDEVSVEPHEYQRYLKMAYEAEEIPEKPRNALGLAKSLPREEMEKLLLSVIRVEPGDLRRLAFRRVTVIRNHLVAGGHVEPGRIFLVEPEVIQDAAARPRATFSMKLLDGARESDPAAGENAFSVADEDPRALLGPPKSPWRRRILGGGAAVAALLLLLAL